MSVPPTIHNPAQYMADLRLALSQGRKRIGLLIGAGAPTAVRVNSDGSLDPDGDPLIPDVAGLTDEVIAAMTEDYRLAVNSLIADLRESSRDVNVETILTRARMLAQSIGSELVHGLNASKYDELAERICKHVGQGVGKDLPPSPNPFSALVSWIAGTHREHPVEIFTPNYDLLLEEAFERVQVPYFDGFSGAHRPFFDAASVLSDSASDSSEQFPSRWARLWKLHGSLGWTMCDSGVVRTGQRAATQLIYPEHVKYEQVRKLPYVALFERLQRFLTTPDTMLISTGFSFRDPHICAVLDESLAANRHTAVLAFQYGKIEEELPARKLALQRPNMSLYARDGAIINGIHGDWQPAEPPTDDWSRIQQTFWREDSEEFLLGDFNHLAQFLALTHSPRLVHLDPDAPSQQGTITGDLPSVGSSDA